MSDSNSTFIKPQVVLVSAHRRGKREQILQWFSANLGERVSSPLLHARYGSSFRTRVSELNRDVTSPIVIRNNVTFLDGEERSVYWSEPRALSDGPQQNAEQQSALFPEADRTYLE
jgi:hypothetical protein